jgi:glycosyltransferase involved in cell wall biosynthesis
MLIDATALQSEHRLRGVGAFVRQLVSAIERTTDLHPTYVVSSVGRSHLGDLFPAARTLVVPRPHTPANGYWIYNEGALRWALVRHRPHVFYAPDFNGLVPNRFGRTVAQLYDLTALKLATAPAKSAMGRASDVLSTMRWRHYFRRLQRTERIIAISDSARADAIAYLGIAPDRIESIHLGVDHVRFGTTARGGRFASHPPYLLHLGGCDANKNQPRLVEAFARIATRHPRVHLLFAGPWSEQDRGWLAETARRHGLEERIRHVGYVPGGDVASLYADALAFVFPSLEEGFGLPVLEAMACGTPVLTSDRSSLPEIAGDAADLVDPLDVDALADGLHRICSDESHRATLRRLGLERASAFTWERTAQRTVQVLRAAAASGGSH